MTSGRIVHILVATQEERVFDILKDRDDVQYDIALYTGTIKDLLPRVQLLIIDYEDVVEYPLSEVELRESIFASRVYECSSQEFLDNPERFLAGPTLNRPGKMFYFPQQFHIAFVSYSGGTGRTTLALDTAYYYAEAMKKNQRKRRRQRAEEQDGVGSLLIEFTFGVSSLIALTGIEMPKLYRLATDTDTRAHVHRGVTLIPMDYENVRVLSDTLLARYLGRQMQGHGLTVIDSIWPHSLINAIAKEIDLWLVVASERPDTVKNAHLLYEELSERFSEERVWLVQNQLAPKALKKADPEWHIRLPLISRPEEYRGELGREILKEIFAPVWAEIDSKARK
ncbi:MAG: hypothetical protein J7M05_00970 [Anaerolineae bacterium]|nr:hypothetical protein [Anaerolineae bacterium]